MIQASLTYPDGINAQFDAQIIHLANISNGEFVGSGVTLETKERDMIFKFNNDEDKDKFRLMLNPSIPIFYDIIDKKKA